MSQHPHPVPFNRLFIKGRLRHLLLLVTLADEGTLHAAAAKLNISQPATTQMLADLENLLDVRLFVRHARGVTPTPAARELVPVCRFVIQTLDAALRRLSSPGSSARQAMRLGCVPAASCGPVFSRIGTVLQRLSGFDLTFEEDSMPRLLPALMAGGLDAIVGRLPQHMEGLHFTPIESDYPLALCATTHPLAGQAGLAPSALLAYPWVVNTMEPDIETYTTALLSTLGAARKVIMLRTNSLPVIFSALHTSTAICVSPSSIAPLIELTPALAFLDVALPQQPNADLSHIGLLTREANEAQELQGLFDA